MDRVIATNSVPFASRDLAPGSGTPQYFTPGVPGTTPATVVPGYFLNMLQDEMRAVIVAAGITPDGANWAQLLQAIIALTGSGRLLNIQVFSGAGSYTYTPTAGMKTCIPEVVGGGAAGGGTGATGAGNSAAGGGGGAGAYAKGRFTAAAVGASQPVTVGAAGAGNVSFAGSNGGTTSVGALISAPGGTGGAVGMATGSFVSAGGAGGSGGATPTGGTIEAIPGIGGLGGLTYGVASAAGGFGGTSRMGYYGNGGAGSLAPQSTAATAGFSGIDGKVLIWEFS